MYFSQKATHLTGFIITVFLSYVISYPELDEDQTLNLKLGFDLKQGTDGTPSISIRNDDDSFKSRKLNGHKERVKRSVRLDSSSDSEEVEDNKEDDTIKGKDTDLSDDIESSGSGGDRQISTKGLNSDFDPESRVNVHKSRIHGKYKREDSE